MALYKWDVKLAGIGSVPDNIVYLSQSEYDNLSESEKMDGTSYWIIWECSDNEMLESLRKMITGWWETSSLSLPSPWTIEIPSWCNIVYINWYWNNWNYWYSSFSIILAKWFPSVQYIWHSSWDYAWDCVRVTADWDSRNITFARVASWSWWYAWATITFC